MECLKMCCKNLLGREKEQERQVIRVNMPPAGGPRGVKQTGVSEDYLLSKLPPAGREVPFVFPTFKPSYIQPKGSRYPDLQPSLQSSARSRYAERKAELSGDCRLYNPESSFHAGQKAENRSPAVALHRDTLKTGDSSPQGAVCELRARKQRLSRSMMDLSCSPGHMQRFDSLSNVQSGASSMRSSVQSSLESIALSGDERDLGKVCVRISYQETLEQVWISLVQCSELNLPVDAVEQHRIRFKGIITTTKPVQFKTSIKELFQDVVFMETFVFALRLQQLRCSALVLRLQTHSPRKCSVAECVLPLRQLGPHETEHWLDLSPPSKSSGCHSELHLATCFQPVNGRVQVQVIAAQNLPMSSSPLAQVFFVKAELHGLESVTVMKKTPAVKATVMKKTPAVKASEGECHWAETFTFLLPDLDHAPTLSIKLYSRSSVRRKQCLGQVILGFDSPAPEAVEQWKSTVAQPEISVAAWHRLSRS